MLGYQKRSDYKGIYKKEADKFFKRLLELKQAYSKTENKERALERIQDFYKESHETKLYNERGGLYCQILSDVNNNL